MNALCQKRKSLFLGVSVIFVALTISIILANTRPAAKSGSPITPLLPRVVVLTSQPSAHAPSVTATAKIAAKYDINIVARVSGIIESTESVFSRGSQVIKGDLLLTIEDLDYLTAYAQAESNLAKAEQLLALEKGSFRQAQREWRDLGNDEANDLFLRKPQIAAAEANFKAEKSSLNQARATLERTKIEAPFAGQITDIKANLGQYVTAGSSLARLVSTGYLEIAVPLTINEVARLGFAHAVRQNQSIERDVEVIYRSGFQENFTTTGRLVRFDSVMDEESQVRFAIVEINNAQTPLKTGELVRVNIHGNLYPDSMWLPESALYQRAQIMTIVDNRLTPASIVLLDARDGKILVSGLKPRMHIVVERPIWSAPGTEVEVEFQSIEPTARPELSATEAPEKS